MNRNKAVFLDRDGTIIVHEHYLSSPDQLKLLPNVAEGIRLFKEHGYLIIVVTNQSGVARGFFDEEHLVLIHKKLLRMLKDAGVVIDDIYYCPHHIEGIVEEYRVECDCRKPRPKMLLDAARQHRIDLTKSLMIGDSETDMQAGKNAGCTSILIRNGCPDGTKSGSMTGTNYVVKDLLEAARLFVRYKN